MESSQERSDVVVSSAMEHTDDMDEAPTAVTESSPIDTNSTKAGSTTNEAIRDADETQNATKMENKTKE
jgi:hypothetical protein